MKNEQSKKWYLRAGDFRPEEVSGNAMKSLFGKYVSYAQALEWLEQSNNIFPTKQTAEEASRAVRGFLASFAIVRSVTFLKAEVEAWRLGKMRILTQDEVNAKAEEYCRNNHR